MEPAAMDQFNYQFTSAVVYNRRVVSLFDIFEIVDNSKRRLRKLERKHKVRVGMMRIRISVKVGSIG